MRTKKKYLRPVKPDVKFASPKIAKLINYVMVEPKKPQPQKHQKASQETKTQADYCSADKKTSSSKTRLCCFGKSCPRK